MLLFTVPCPVQVPSLQWMRYPFRLQLPSVLEKQSEVAGPPRVYRIVATGESGKVKKKITAIVDTTRGPDNPITNNYQAEKAAGILQYWREE